MEVRVGVRDPRDPDAQTCLRAYETELASRFDDGFDPALSISAADEEMTPPAGLFLVATVDGEPAGCGALKFHGDAPAEIKRMWVAPSARGLGLGRRLLAELEAHAAAHGVRVLRLETNRTLREAISLYRSAGYREVAAFNDEPYAHHWFEKSLEPQISPTILGPPLEGVTPQNLRLPSPRRRPGRPARSCSGRYRIPRTAGVGGDVTGFVRAEDQLQGFPECGVQRLA